MTLRLARCENTRILEREKAEGNELELIYGIRHQSSGVYSSPEGPCGYLSSV